MDYLDPKKKQAHKTRLLIGYGLFAVAIAIATLVLVYMANGYYVDRNTGQVIQNGLVYVDSRPGGADIYLNGQKQRGSTAARLVLPSGEYEIGLNRTGYRNWSRTLQLEGASLRRLTYAKLIPEVLTTSVGTNLRSDPYAASQSIDKKWLVNTYIDNPLQLSIIDTEQSTITPQILTIPSNIVKSATGLLEIVEWADDDKTFIAKYTVGTNVNYLLIDREKPSEAVNLNTLFADETYQISFQDRKNDKFFVFIPSLKTLSIASLSQGIEPTPVLTNVIDYKTFGRDWVLYVTESGKDGLVEVRFKRGDKDILIKNIKTDDKYLLQLAKLGNAPIMGISSPVEDRAIIYNDPEAYLNDNPDVEIPIATTVLRVVDPIDLRISADSSVIMVYGLSNFASHEFEADRSYNFKVDVPIDPLQELRWLDGQHFLFSSEGKQIMMDFDGSNRYELVDSIPVLGSFFTKDIDIMYSFTPAKPAEGEVPATPATVSITNLLTPEDR